MEKSQLRQILEDMQESIKQPVLDREVWPQIEHSLKLPEVTILTGLRRVGKTSLMKKIAQVYGGTYVDFEDERLASFQPQDWQKLLELSEDILLLDEIELAPMWERFVRRAMEKKKIVVSGSNSALLESDFWRALVGRTYTIVVHPLNYREFLRFRGMPHGEKAAHEYLALGGFPRIVMSGEEKLREEYWKSIIYRDIVPRVGYERETRLVLAHLSLSTGKKLSFRKISHKTGVPLNKVIEIIRVAQKGFLLDELQLYHPKPLARERLERKFYWEEHTLSYVHRGNSPNIGLENAVFHHLPKEKFFFLFNGKEIDFYLPSLNLYIQVAYRLGENKDRELSPLAPVKGKKLLISFDECKEVPTLKPHEFFMKGLEI